MNVLRLLPIILSALLLGAHFLREGLLPLVVLAVAFPAVLFIRRAWAARLVQVILVLGALEWLRTLLVLVAIRRLYGQPWARLAIILGVVAIFTGGSALLLSLNRSLRERYGLGGSLTEAGDSE